MKRSSFTFIVSLLSCGPSSTTTPNNETTKPTVPGGAETLVGAPFGVGKVVVEKGNELLVLDLATGKTLYAYTPSSTVPFLALSEDGLSLTLKESEMPCQTTTLATKTQTSCQAPGSTFLDLVLAAGAADGVSFHAFDQGESAPFAVGKRAAGTFTKLRDWDFASEGNIVGGGASRDGSVVLLVVLNLDEQVTKYFLLTEDGVATLAVDFTGSSPVASCSGPALSRDGARLAHCEGDPSTPPFLTNVRTVVRDVGGGIVAELAGSERFALSPDGERLVWANNDGVLHSTTFLPLTTTIIADRIVPGGNIAFTTDGARVLADVAERGVVSYDARTLGDARILLPYDESESRQLFSDVLSGLRDITSR